MPARRGSKLSPRESGIQYSAIDDDEEQAEPQRWCCIACCGVKFLPRWFVICGISLAVLASLILVGIFLILPIVVQGIVAQSELQFTTISITQPQENQFLLSAQGFLNNAGFLKAQISETNITVEYDGEILGTMTMPSLTVEGSTPITVTSTFNLTNVTLYESYIKSLLLADKASQIPWNLKGKPTISALGMSWQVDFDKSVGIGGMGGLKDVTVLGIDLPRNSPYGGLELFLNASQYNPSPISVYIGNITLEFFYQGSFMGMVWASNFTLQSGHNLLSLQGYMNPDNLTLASVFMSDYLAGKDSAVIIQGVDAGNSKVGWVQYMVKLLHIPSVLPGGKNLTLMHDITLETLGMEFISNSEVYAGSSIVAGFNSPFSFPLSITEVSCDIQMIQDDVTFARISGPYFPARSDQKLGLVWVEFAHVPTSITDPDLFSDLVNDLLLYPSASTTLKGIARVIASTVMGNLTLTGIPFGQAINIVGMSGFANAMEVVNQNIIGGQVDIMSVNLELAVTNPSNLVLKAPTLPFYMSLNGTIVGNSSVIPLVLNANTTNNAFAQSYLVQDGTNDDLIGYFISCNVMAQPITITVKGAPDQTNINVMKKALSNFQTQTVVPGVRVDFLQYFQMELNIEQLLKGIIPTKITALNPWPIGMSITSIYQIVYLTDNHQRIAHLYEDISSNPIIIPANQTVITSPQPVAMDGISIQELYALIGTVSVTVEGTMTAYVDKGFVTTINYVQKGIPTSFWAS